jgi:hypothetical protein
VWCVEQVWLEKRYVSSRHNSEWFNTAGRNIKTGLIASVIVSQVSSQVFHIHVQKLALVSDGHNGKWSLEVR